MTISLRFPVWRYLNQPLFDADCPPILNPRRYWQLYTAWHLEQCLSNNWVERCWHVDYYEFIEKAQAFVDRHYLEEDNLVFIEHCWALRYWRCCPDCHPEELISDA